MNSIPDEWFDPEMPMGESRRYRHPNCSEGKDKALTITRMHDGWVFWCHRCRTGGKKFAKGLSPQAMLKWVRSSKVRPVEYTDTVVLPEDFTQDISKAGMAWLYTKGIHDTEIAKYGIGYSKKLNRVIFPVYDQEKLIYWTGRYLGKPDKEHPKWANMVSKRKGLYFKALRGQRDSIVLVEDILSAIKVGRISDCYALLSINVDDTLMFDLGSRYETVYLWLDRDKWNKMNLYTMRYRSFGLDVRPIRTKRDPKAHSDVEIREKIYGDS